MLAAASTTTVDCRFADVELVDPERFIGTLPAKFGALCDSPCGASVLGAAAVATGVSGVAASRATGDDATARGLAGAAMATAAGIPVWVGVAPADVVVSLLDGVELVCAPLELFLIPERRSAVGASVGEEVELAWASTDLFLIPERGSAVGASHGEGVELAWASTDLCTTPDVEPDEEAAAEADESVDDVGSVDDVLAADSDEELEADDDEPGELVSVGSANATPGVVATAPPTPSANANTPARTMYCAFTGIALRGQSARALAERPPEPACSARWDPAAVKVILATFLVDAVGLRCRLLIARVLSVRAHEVSCRVRAGEVARPADCFRVETSPASPQGAARGSRVRFRWTGWVPRLHPRVFVGVPAQWMEFGAKGRRRPAAGKGSAGLGHDGNVWRRSRHLLRNQRFLRGANLQRPLKPHDTSAFPQVLTDLYLPVAIL